MTTDLVDIPINDSAGDRVTQGIHPFGPVAVRVA